jgi:diacylglycerol O-acyltransferase
MSVLFGTTNLCFTTHLSLDCPLSTLIFGVQMTSIGRFSYESETTTNPSVPTLFFALTGPKPFTAAAFVQLWKDRGVSEKHPRFEQCIDSEKPGYFVDATKALEDRVSDTMFPRLYRADLAYRMGQLLTAPLDVTEALWEAKVTSGPVGTSGAISKIETEHLPASHTSESLIMFRSHHALADGASLVAAFMELCDEADEIKAKVKAALKLRRKKAKSLLQRILRWFQRFLWFWQGYVQGLFYQTRLVLGMPHNPFELVLKMSGDEHPEARRNVSWCNAAPLEEVKQVARANGRKVTINDVWISCVSYAIAMQLEEHRQRLDVRGKTLPKFPHINIVVPVHLSGGILLPNQAIGNFIGAFAARIPGESHDSSHRLATVHKTLTWIKQSPTPLISYLGARSSSMVPLSWTKYFFRRASANAAVSVSNVRGSPTKLHIGGNTVESIAGFLPLPPGVPVGVVIKSYAGTVSLSVTAQPWAVPDADQFLVWMLEEYQRLKDESNK